MTWLKSSPTPLKQKYVQTCRINVYSTASSVQHEIKQVIASISKLLLKRGQTYSRTRLNNMFMSPFLFVGSLGCTFKVVLHRPTHQPKYTPHPDQLQCSDQVSRLAIHIPVSLVKTVNAAARIDGVKRQTPVTQFQQNTAQCDVPITHLPNTTFSECLVACVYRGSEVPSKNTLRPASIFQIVTDGSHSPLN